MYNNDFFQSTTMDSSVNGDNNYVNQDVDVDVTMMNNNTMPSTNNGVQERIINRTFIHEVPHTCPIHTRIINHHVYKHTYRPVYTCSEENVCSNVQCGSCSNFR